MILGVGGGRSAGWKEQEWKLFDGMVIMVCLNECVISRGCVWREGCGGASGKTEGTISLLSVEVAEEDPSGKKGIVERGRGKREKRKRSVFY